jgi:hypothetical protein
MVEEESSLNEWFPDRTQTTKPQKTLHIHITDVYKKRKERKKERKKKGKFLLNN